MIHLPAQSDAIFAEYDRVKRLTLRVFQTVAVVLDFCRIQSECVLWHLVGTFAVAVGVAFFQETEHGMLVVIRPCKYELKA